MSLKDLNIKLSYKTRGTENVLNDFLIPALQCAKHYKRSVGFFSSSVFELIKAGLENFLNGESKIQIICSPELSVDDYDAIRLGYRLKEELYKEKFKADVDLVLENLANEELKILVCLITEGALDIKIVMPTERNGIYHDKIGYIEDFEGNQVLFVGSPNESKYAYLENYEKIRVSKSWQEGGAERIADDLSEFEDIWYGTNKYLKQIDVNSEITYKINNVIKSRNKNKEEYLEEGKKDSIQLRDYQNEAIDCWKKNNFNGFFVMATGTGKTWTALYATKELTKEKPILIVICAPYKHLIKQWQEDIVKLYDDNDVIMVSSENKYWEDELYESSMAINYGEKKTVIVLSTIMSFNKEKFIDRIKKFKLEKLLIVDEAHRFKNFSNSLKDTYKYMIGLSATPSSRKNDEYAKQLLEFFGGQVFNLPIEFAIRKGYLVHYNYYPIFVNATEEEECRFNEISKQMSGLFRNDICIDIDKLIKLKRNQLRLISMAEEKKDNIDWILSKIQEKKQFIVYCGDGKVDITNDINHINFIENKLKDRGFKVGKFTATESMSERKDLIDMFSKGTIDSLVAIKCLDEGINIPSINGAMILSSNDNIREFVQRRGRILRKHTDEYSGEKKRVANIYDVVVIPTVNCCGLAKIELRRVYEYMRLADNKSEYEKDIDGLLSLYNIDVKELYYFDEMEEELDE